MGMCACSGGIPYNIMYYIIISALTRLEKLIIISRLSKSKRFFPKIYSVAVSTDILGTALNEIGQCHCIQCIYNWRVNHKYIHLHQIRVCHELPQVQAPVIMALKSLNYKHMLYLSGNGLVVKCN